MVQGEYVSPKYTYRHSLTASKVAESGYLGNDKWATDSLNSNCGRFSFRVPSCIASGDYLVRAEVIALHVAGNVGGAQLWVSNTLKMIMNWRTCWFPAICLATLSKLLVVDPQALRPSHSQVSTTQIQFINSNPVTRRLLCYWSRNQIRSLQQIHILYHPRSSRLQVLRRQQLCHDPKRLAFHQPYSRWS